MRHLSNAVAEDVQNVHQGCGFDTARNYVPQSSCPSVRFGPSGMPALGRKPSVAFAKYRALVVS